jgi:hypothetical protein
MYSNNTTGNEAAPPLPLLFNDNAEENSEVMDLELQGWKPLY